MIGFLILFFIGKAFFNLAKKHRRNKWLFAILGVLVGYGMLVIGGLLIVFIVAYMGNDAILDSSDSLIGFMGIPVGILSAWLFYYLLRKNWEGNPKNRNAELLDSSDF